MKVLNVLLGGGGPDVAFRAYLLTAVRRLHIDKVRSTQRATPTDDLTPFDPGVPFTDTAVAGFEGGAAAKAFASLPERWQMVLWHLEVENQKPADIAPLLGMSANSVSALAYRAREGLRQAFLNMHSGDLVSDACRETNGLLGGYVRGALSRRDATRVEDHLEHCRPCTAAYLELSEVNSSLAAILGPALLGGVAAAYLGGGAPAPASGQERWCSSAGARTSFSPTPLPPRPRPQRSAWSAWSASPSSPAARSEDPAAAEQSVPGSVLPSFASTPEPDPARTRTREGDVTGPGHSCGASGRDRRRVRPGRRAHSASRRRPRQLSCWTARATSWRNRAEQSGPASGPEPGGTTQPGDGPGPGRPRSGSRSGGGPPERHRNPDPKPTTKPDSPRKPTDKPSPGAIPHRATRTARRRRRHAPGRGPRATAGHGLGQGDRGAQRQEVRLTATASTGNFRRPLVRLPPVGPRLRLHRHPLAHPVRLLRQRELPAHGDLQGDCSRPATPTPRPATTARASRCPAAAAALVEPRVIG